MSQLNEERVVQVKVLFERMGAGVEQSEVMARQLVKRASQIASEQKISEVEAMETLLKKVVEARHGG